MSTGSARLAAALLVPLLFGGCASIVSGQNQSISVVSKSNGEDLNGAKCALQNNKGTWYATTPGSVTVRRSYGDLTVNCTSDSAQPGSSTVKSSTKAMAFGNILFGGVIGVGVDVGTGAAYDYPEIVTVHMGKVTDIAATNAARVRDEKVALQKRSDSRFPPPVEQTAASTLPAPAPMVATTAVKPPPPAPPPAPISSPSPSTAPMVATAATPPPALRSTSGGIETGQDAYQVQRIAKDQACHPNPSAVLTAKGPGFESYVVTCSNGDAVAFRCEFGACRALK